MTIEEKSSRSSVPIPKFAKICGTLSCELRNQRDTSKFRFLVPLLNPKFAIGLAARVCELRVRGTRSPLSSHFVGEFRLDLIAVAQRCSGIGDDDLAFAHALANFDGEVGVEADADAPGLDHLVAHHLNAG